ncbi:MAG: hypothetical protein CMB64_05125 [Euryarchaeota archaeon]|nr:hypothetical protein [Euryarchaeota archaeon]
MGEVFKRHGLLVIVFLFTSCFFIPVHANDSDSDGVLDINDDCPYSEGDSVIDRLGCPDRDSDGKSDLNDFWTSPQGDFNEIEVIDWEDSGDIESVDFSPDGNFIVIGDDSGALTIFETSTRDIILSVIESEDRPIYEVEWSPNGEYILAGNQFEEILVYDVTTLVSSSTISLVDTLTTDFGTTNDLIADIEFSPDSSMVAVTIAKETLSNDNDGGLVILDSTDWSEIGRYDPSNKDNNYDSVDWSPDGNILALGGAGEVFLLDPNNGFNEIRVPLAITSTDFPRVNGLSWSPDGNMLAICDQYESTNVGHSVYLYDTISWTKEWDQQLSTSCLDVEFSPDSRQVAAAAFWYGVDGDSVKVFNALSGSIVDIMSGNSGDESTPDPSVFDIAWSPNGINFVVAHGYEDVRLSFWEGDDDPDNDGWPTIDRGNGDVDAFPLDGTQWTDSDGDGFGDNPPPANNFDNCIDVVGNSTEDRNGCPDSDGDGYSDSDLDWNETNGADVFPLDPTQWSDSDGDGYGDNLDGNYPDRFPQNPTQWNDTDGDGFGDNLSGIDPDLFPTDPTQWSDEDGDGYGDNPFGNSADSCPDLFGNSSIEYLGCPDSDGDGWGDENEDFPWDSDQWKDSDGDGFGDNPPPANNSDDCLETSGTSWIDRNGCVDSDEDGYSDLNDDLPYNPTQWNDSDGDGYGDNPDGVYADKCPDEYGLSDLEEYLGCIDSDGDGVADFDDDFPQDSSQWKDSDGDGYGDNPNGDTSDDCIEIFGTSSQVGLLGCLDSDGDGYGDILDDFPNESTQWSDSDNDGYGDNEDGLNGDDCVLTFGTSYIDKFGCLDSDNDGYSDVFDDCVDEAGTSSEGVIGCIDQDGDGFADIVDECPNDETKWEYGISCIDSEIVTEEPNKNENTTIEENNNEENIVGQCTCPDGSIGMLVGPSDDDGTPDGCSCSNLNNESSESSSNLEFDDIISIIILLFSIILLLLFVKQVRGVSSRKKFRNNISEEMKINAAFESEDFASGGWDEIDMRK